MAHYVIGDVQGCRAALEDLLHQCRFDPAADQLWFAGDLIARGPDSLGTLRLIHGLRHCVDSVLGNHDLHLLAVRHGHGHVKKKDGTQPLLEAGDSDLLLDWLQQRPLLLELPDRHLLTHAGVPPWWDLDTLRHLAREVEQALRGPDAAHWLGAMYGNDPAIWQPELRDGARLRVIINALTRMRMLHADGRLDLSFKEAPADAPPGLTPWFQLPNPGLAGHTLLFGHWAALLGRTHSERHIGLDTGCVWGNTLTAYRLDDGRRFHSRQGLR